MTTTPLSLADAVEKILTPLKLIKVPAHEIGLMLSMSLRFVPTLVDDTNRIMNAQRARGVDFGEGNLLKRIRSFIPILIPLFASSFKRADALAIAMEARGYKGGRDDALSESAVGGKRYPSIARYSVPDVDTFFI